MAPNNSNIISHYSNLKYSNILSLGNIIVCDTVNFFVNAKEKTKAPFFLSFSPHSLHPDACSARLVSMNEIDWLASFGRFEGSIRKLWNLTEIRICLKTNTTFFRLVCPAKEEKTVNSMISIGFFFSFLPLIGMENRF